MIAWVILIQETIGLRSFAAGGKLLQVMETFTTFAD